MSTIQVNTGAVIGGDFEIIRLLASGAMGSVYIVNQLSTGKRRALKLMSASLASDPKSRDRFVLEARIASQLESDHIVEVVTAGIDADSGSPFLVMELLKGQELGELIEQTGALGIHRVGEIMRQAGHALEQAHQAGIVHRDLKPENLFIAESRRDGVPFTVKILDFGIAKLVAENSAQATQAVGTPLYMSPEQADQRAPIQPSTDVWALGLITFYLLTGQSYWIKIDESIQALLTEVLVYPLVSASERATSLGVPHLLPIGFDDWFSKCVNREQSERFATAGLAIAALDALIADVAANSVANSADLRFEAALYEATIRFSSPSMVHDQRASTPMALAQGSSSHVPVTTIHSAETSAMQGKRASKSTAFAVLGGVGIIAAIAAFAVLSGRDKVEAVKEEATAKTNLETDSTAIEGVSPSTASSGTALPNAQLQDPECPLGMILIKGGNMFMGSTDEDLGEDVRPPHKVQVSSFCLDRTEVTVEMYADCVLRGECLRSPLTVNFSGATEDQISHLSTKCNSPTDDSKAKHPVNCIDWQMANTFCTTHGGRLVEGQARLPTEAEWEFAARGSGQKIYPWGDEPPSSERLNACGSECVNWLNEHHQQSWGQMYEEDDHFAGTAPVGSFPKGASSAGVLDLAGNVWEWTFDRYGAYTDAQEVVVDPMGPMSGEERSVRGGGHNGLKPSWAKPAYRWKTLPEARSEAIGFRCAKSLDQAE